MDTRDRASVLMDGPPARAPERVHEGMVLRGRRVLVNGPDGEWVHDLRAVDDPYWHDPDVLDQAHSRSQHADTAPPGARLTVAVCTEPDWYEWGRTRRRPEVREYPAYLVWAE